MMWLNLRPGASPRAGSAKRGRAEVWREAKQPGALRLAPQGLGIGSGAPCQGAPR